MKHLPLTTIEAVLLVGCGPSPNELPIQAALDGNIEAVKQHLAACIAVNATGKHGVLPLRQAPSGE